MVSDWVRFVLEYWYWGYEAELITSGTLARNTAECHASMADPTVHDVGRKLPFTASAVWGRDSR